MFFIPERMVRKTIHIGEKRLIRLLEIHGGGLEVEISDEAESNKKMKMTITRFREFVENVPRIVGAVEALRRHQDVNIQPHLGGNFYISVTQGILCVDFRYFWLDRASGQLKPTRNGIALKIREWESFRAALPGILQCCEPELSIVQRCVDEGAVHSCYECNPNNNTKPIC